MYDLFEDQQNVEMFIHLAMIKSYQVLNSSFTATKLRFFG